MVVWLLSRSSRLMSAPTLTFTSSHFAHLSFAFLTNAVGLILPGSVAVVWFVALVVWTPINLYQTLRGAYGSSVLGAVLKTLVVWTTAVLAFGLLLLALMVFSLNQL